MAESTDVNKNIDSFMEAWKKFVKTVETLLTSNPNDRGMDQYLQFRDHLLEFLDRPEFADQFKTGCTKVSPDALKLLSMEIEPFPRAVEVAKAESESGAVKENELKGFIQKWWKSKWLGKASIITTSVKDILDPGKGTLLSYGLIIFNEAIDLFQDHSK